MTLVHLAASAANAALKHTQDRAEWDRVKGKKKEKKKIMSRAMTNDRNSEGVLRMCPKIDEHVLCLDTQHAPSKKTLLH